MSFQYFLAGLIQSAASFLWLPITSRPLSGLLQMNWKVDCRDGDRMEEILRGCVSHEVGRFRRKLVL